MSKKKLEISRHNWDLGPHLWDKMKWEIFDDLSIVRTVEYLEVKAFGQASKKRKFMNIQLDKRNLIVW